MRYVKIQHSFNEYGTSLYAYIHWTCAVFSHIAREMNNVCIFSHDQITHDITVIHCAQSAARLLYGLIMARSVRIVSYQPNSNISHSNKYEIGTLIARERYVFDICFGGVNHCSAKLIYLSVYPLDVVSRYRDPQLRVRENYSYLLNSRSLLCKSWCLNTHPPQYQWFYRQIKQIKNLITRISVKITTL